MMHAAAACPGSGEAWLDHLSVGGAIAVAFMAIACAVAISAFFWALTRQSTGSHTPRRVPLVNTGSMWVYPVDKPEDKT